MTLRERLDSWLSHDTHPFIQFIKYGLAGGAATVTDITVFYLLSWLVIPDLTPDDKVVKLLHLHVEPLPPAVQERHFYINRCLTFLVSNFVAYVLNVLFVFKPGRHSRLKEFGLFYLVSAISFVIGTGLGGGIIHFLHCTTTAAFLANMAASLAINFVCRKYLIFKG
jgi:putative flippase GtrA